MLDLLTALVAAPAPCLPYAGPERRDPRSALARWLAAALDEIDYGVLLVVDGTQVIHANHVALAELDAEHPLQLAGRTLHPRHAGDAAPLREALADARRRGLRRLLMLGDTPNRVSVSIVPLPTLHDHPVTMLVFGKRQVCGPLSVHGFARAHGLTAAETRVLEALCDGATPHEIAHRQQVAISTVRTQIGRIRVKTQAESIRDMVRKVAVLPPLVGALRAGLAPGRWAGT